MVVIAGIDVGKYNLEVSVAESRAKAFSQHRPGHWQTPHLLGGTGRHQGGVRTYWGL